MVSGPLATAVGEALDFGGTAQDDVADRHTVMLLVILVILAFLGHAPNA